MVRVGAVLPFTKYSIIISVAILLTAAVVLERFLVRAAPAGGRDSSTQAVQSLPAVPINSRDITQSTVNSETPAAGLSSNSSSDSASVTVNGQNIPVPQNGSYSQTIQSDDSTTTVNIQNQSTSTSDTAGNSSHNSLQVNVRSSSNGTQESQ